MSGRPAEQTVRSDNIYLSRKRTHLVEPRRSVTGAWFETLWRPQACADKVEYTLHVFGTHQRMALLKLRWKGLRTTLVVPSP